jgi:phosphate transporter
MGGSALGKAVGASGLLSAMDNLIRDMVDGLSLTTVVFVLSAIVLVVSTFISHTIASILLCKIAAEVGEKLPEPHRNLLVFLTALLCSTGMGMPVSGFPNQTACVLCYRATSRIEGLFF